DGRGITAPIEVKLRPQGAGVVVVKERTKQERDAARLRGEEISDSEDEKRRKKREKKKKDRQDEGSGSGTARRKKEKTKFMTAEEIESSGLHVPSVLKQIVDLTGKEARLISSSDISTPKAEVSEGPSPEEIEQAKIARLAQRDLESFGQEWKSLQERKKYNAREQKRLTALVDEQAEQTQRLNGMVEAAVLLQNLQLHDFSYEDAVGQVVAGLEKMQFEYQNELASCGLTDIAIAVLVPLVSRLLYETESCANRDKFKEGMSDWDPLENPSFFVEHLRRIRIILGIRNKQEIEASFAAKGPLAKPSKTTSFYESMILGHWLPKVRS